MEKQYRLGTFIDSWMPGEAYDVTFVVTEECNLRCKYCYQVDKNNKNVMTFEIAKKAVDYIIDNPDIFNSKAVVWNFIGGEPLLEIELIDKIADYIKIKTFESNHRWFSLYRFNISTNGILYDNKKVQDFIKKNHEKLSIGISFDGIKEKHNLQRVYKDGRGSYDDVAKNIPLWLEQYSHATTKVTIGSDDLKYVKDSIVHLWKLGIHDVPANVVFEDVWKNGDDIIFEEQLRQLADYIIDNKLWNKYNTSLFSDDIGYPNDEETLSRSNCGTGMMLAIDSKGNFYPCLRFTGFCLQNKPGYVIGNVYDGLDFDKIRPFVGLQCKDISDDECINCEVATGCSWCQGYNYDASKDNTNYNREKFICKMHKARCRANEYYWSRLREEFNIKRVNFRSDKKKHLFFIMDDNCVEHCNYKSFDKSNMMPENVIINGLKYAEENFYKPVILQSKVNKNIVNINKYSFIDRTEIYYNGTSYTENNCEKILMTDKNNMQYNIEADNCIVNISQDSISQLYNIVERIFKKCHRINLNIIDYSQKFDYDTYSKELEKISNLLVHYYKLGKNKEFNKLTDIIFLEGMDNCNFGSDNFALAPNGKIYVCPKFYFENKDDYIGDLENGFLQDKSYLFKLKNSPICRECNSYHCNRCVYLNKQTTNEYNTPSLMQCKISMIEKTQSCELLKTLKQLDIVDSCKEIELTDAFEKILSNEKAQSYNKNVFLKGC